MRLKLSRLQSLLLCGSISILSNPTASAQAWRDGFIFMTNGDSVSGQIDFTDPSVSASWFRFRPTPGSASVTYSTNDVKSFGFHASRQRFEKLEAEIKYYSKGVVQDGNNPVVGTRKILAYAEVIRASRSITLYSVRDDNTDERFFVKKDNALTELLNISYVVERSSSMSSTRFKVEETLYKGQLMGLIADCTGAQKGSFSYTESSLGRVVDNYIACKGESGANTGNQAPETLMIGGFFSPLTGHKDGESIGWGASTGVTVQALSRKNRGNQFFWFEAGVSNHEVLAFPVYIGVFTGTYIGHGRVQPLIDFGLTTLTGSFNAGAGVAWQKRVVLSGSVNTRFFSGEMVLYNVKLAVYPRIGRKS